jgi:hypothetical protein
MQTGPSEDFGKLSSPERRNRRLELLDERRDEVGEPVDGLAGAEQSIGSLLVAAMLPGGERGGGDQESARGRSHGPASGRRKRQDRKPLARSIVRPPRCFDAGHARILDLELAPKERDLRLKALIFDLQSSALEGAVSSPACVFRSIVITGFGPS